VGALQTDEEAMKSLQKTNESTLQGAIALTKTNADYAATQAAIIVTVDELQAKKAALYPWETEKINEINAKISEQGAKYAENQDKFRAAMEEKFALMAIEKIAMSDGIAGFSDGEMQKATAVLSTMNVVTAAALSEQLAQEALTAAVADGTITVQQFGDILNSSMRDGVVTVDEVRAGIDALTDKTVTVNVNTVYTVTGEERVPGKNRAVGGPSMGRTIVGEAGPEVVDLPNGAFVHSNNASKSMMNNNQPAAPDNSAALMAALANNSYVLQGLPAAIERALRQTVVLHGIR
jgi:hypothetical protein